VWSVSMFESSMHYRSAMVMGAGSAVAGADKEAALRTLSEHLMPGRSGDGWPPSTRELAQTMIVAVPHGCRRAVDAAGVDPDRAVPAYVSSWVVSSSVVSSSVASSTGAG